VNAPSKLSHQLLEESSGFVMGEDCERGLTQCIFQ
jgi:hypothetical protein